jgi:lipopolysaccharide biosynthesis regulator YciM
MSASTLSAAFAIGFLAGRKAKAEKEPVRPRIIYFPLTNLEQQRGPPSELYQELAKYNLPPDVVARIVERSEEVYRKLREVEEAEEMILKATRAINENKISPTTYHMLINRYLQRYIEKKRELEEAQEGLRALLRSIGTLSAVQRPLG